jgi:RecA/RadA recombinase
MSDIDTLKKSFIKKFGEGIIQAASDFKDRPLKIIPIGPKIDHALNGGVPEGSWVNISGPKKVGKTSTTLQLCCNAQNLFGKPIYYIDAEHRMKLLNLYGIEGLNLDDFQIIRSPKKNRVAAEELLDIMLEIMTIEDGAVFVIDSVSSLLPKDQLAEEKISATGRSSTPKMMKNFCKKAGPLIANNGHVVVAIQHLIANTSGYGAPYMEDGGTYVQYAMDIGLRAKKAVGVITPAGQQVGQVVTWQVLCSALGPPHPDFESTIRYNKGIDVIGELVELCSDFGTISKGGSWYTLEFLPEKPKVQGLEKTIEYFNAHPAALTLLKNEFDNILCSLKG